MINKAFLDKEAKCAKCKRIVDKFSSTYNANALTLEVKASCHGKSERRFFYKEALIAQANAKEDWLFFTNDVLDNPHKSLIPSLI